MDPATILLAGAALAAGAVGAYAVLVEPFVLRVRRRRPQPAAWPADLPLRVVVVADVHMAPPWMTLKRLERIAAAAEALEGDLVVLLGDTAPAHRLTLGRASPEAAARILGGIRAPLGVWTVLGNHDWTDDAAAQRRRAGPTHWHAAFAAAGVPVLENDAVRLEKDGRPFWLVGLGSQRAFELRRRIFRGADDLDAALAPTAADEAPALLLAHEPDIFPKVPARVALTLSGHTHGGQINLFGWTPVVPSRYGSRYVYGHVEEGGRHLVVSGGLGCSGLPVRFLRPPEIVVVELGPPEPDQGSTRASIRR